MKLRPDGQQLGSKPARSRSTKWGSAYSKATTPAAGLARGRRTRPARALHALHGCDPPAGAALWATELFQMPLTD